MTVKSPCKSKCELDNNKEYCISCLRTVDEIKNWSIFSDKKKTMLKKELKKRKVYV